MQTALQNKIDMLDKTPFYNIKFSIKEDINLEHYSLDKYIPLAFLPEKIRFIHCNALEKGYIQYRLNIQSLTDVTAKRVIPYSGYYCESDSHKLRFERHSDWIEVDGIKERMKDDSTTYESNELLQDMYDKLDRFSKSYNLPVIMNSLKNEVNNLNVKGKFNIYEDQIYLLGLNIETIYGYSYFQAFKITTHYIGGEIDEQGMPNPAGSLLYMVAEYRTDIIHKSINDLDRKDYRKLYESLYNSKDK